jgi:hypothetical protein
MLTLLIKTLLRCAGDKSEERMKTPILGCQRLLRGISGCLSNDNHKNEKPFGENQTGESAMFAVSDNS